MSWVRYDDQFHMHVKVTAVIAEDAGAIALHVLANTWSNTQKRPGFIPAHQPGMLLCDKRKGAKWAVLLVKHGLWHRRGEECAQCREEYADLTEGVDGFVVHNAKEYRAPARDRSTPGTPSDLSEKRRQAGRAGGKASAARREQAKQGGQARQANGVSKTSNLPPAGVSPVVKASNEALTPDPVPGLFASEEANPSPPAGASPAATAGPIIAEWIKSCRKRPPDQVIGQVGKHVKDFLKQQMDPEDIAAGLEAWQTKGLNPSALASVVNEVMNARPREARTPAIPQQSRNAQIVDAAMQRAIAAEQRMSEEAQFPRGAIAQ